MDFAKNLLEKYGWTEGKGLGRNENGISEALKPKLKFDRSGIDHDIAEQFTNNWWERLYNKASSNINVKRNDENVSINLNGNSIDITTREYSLKKDASNCTYGAFIKKSTLTSSGMQTTSNNSDSETDTDNEVDKKKSKTERTSGILNLTDEQLLAACGGRTAHKGARYGLNLKGKLNRIEQQEKEFQEKVLKKQALHNISDKSKTISKDKKSKKKMRATEQFLTELQITSIEKKKTSKTKKKCESCNHKKCTCPTNIYDINAEVFVKKITPKSKKTKSAINEESSDAAVSLKKKKRKLGISEEIDESNSQKNSKIQKKKKKKNQKKLKKIAKSLDSLKLD